MRRILPLMIVLGVVTLGPLAAQQRGSVRPARTGTAGISGTVIDDATPAAVIRRAIVTIADPDSGVTQSTTTDDDGRFGFEGLPPGRYHLTASKGGYIAGAYGAFRLGGQGMPIAVTDGARVPDRTIRIFRGAVITGTVRDTRGNPIVDARVIAARPGTVLVDVLQLNRSFPGGFAFTDDRGVYRIFGLKPGDYVVWASAPVWVQAGQTLVTSTVDVQRAQALIRGGPDSITARPSTGASRAVVYADTYYPGAASPADAQVLRLAPGDERAGVDMARLLVPTARIDGDVQDTAGRPLENPRVWIDAVGPGGTQRQFELTTTADGTFTVPHVMPGRYEIGAQGRNGPDQRNWARQTIVVNGADISGVTLRLQPGLQVRGRVEFEPGAPAPDRGGLTLTLIEAGRDVLHTVPEGTTDADGVFAIDGVAPGRYLLQLLGPDRRPVEAPPGWRLKSILGAGPDAADVPLQVSVGAPVPNLVVTYTSTTNELTGALQDAQGRPVTDFTVVAFCADRSLWGPQSRRIHAARPSSDGRYSFKNLPAGEYLLAAVVDVEDDQWFHPRFLEPLTSTAARVTVAEQGRTVQDLQVGRW